MGWACACTPPDPKTELALSDVETYWVVDSSKAGARYLAPAVRFRITNVAATRPIQATATFRRQGEEATWGSDWQTVLQGGEALPVGGDTVVVMRSDGRYYSHGTAAAMLTHAQFKDAQVEVFLRIGSSGWVKMLSLDVERRIGARGVEDMAGL